MKKFTLDATFLPGKAEEMSGMFTITRDDLTLKNIRTNMVDSLLTVSGNFRKFPADIRAIDLSLQGDIGPEVTSWVSRLIDLPTEMQLRPHLTVRDASVSWEKDNRTSFDGRLVFGKETEVSLKLTKTRDELSVNEISVKDRDTDVTANAVLNKKTIDMAFKGILASSTFKTIFANSTFSDSSLQGDFRTHIVLNDPKHSMANGILSGKNIPVPWGNDTPLVIQNINLEAGEKHVKIDSAQFLIGDEQFSGKGN